ncbi:MAG: IS1634 family transposase [Euzebyaceae bacterium]|jgi:transposase|nr:IS1634 family transposase [Euzebyaceae bacterium]
MASIIGKKIKGQTYYYLREVARVGGKPKIVSQRYLGKAEDVAAAMDGATVLPERTRHIKFGALAAVWRMLERLDAIAVIDDVVGPRRSDAAASVGTYIALACANRVVAPCSKLAFTDWWATTAGDRWVKVPTAALDHRRFWDAMHTLSTQDLRRIETRLAQQMVATFDLDLSALVLDMTNFATFIHSANPRAPIAQRGKAKQKRTDLRLVALALVITRDGGVPVVSHAYAGNRPDVTQFSAVIDELTARYRQLTHSIDDLTVVYDAGQNSEDNHADMEATGLGFVGSLPPSNHPDLLAVPLEEFSLVDPDRFDGLTAHDTTVTALGVTRRAVITHSPTFHTAQARGFDQTLAKARRQLGELQARLARGKSRKPRAGVEAEIAKILRPRWVNRVITTTLTGEDPTTFRLTWRTNTRARTRLETELFGKRILFTNRTDWPLADVITAYRSQADVEAGFRQMKDPHVVSFSPMHHWTDQKIRVHVFYCVLALTTAHLLRREAANAGITMSVRELLTTLDRIEETVLIYPSTGGRPKARRTLTEMTPTAQRLYDLYDLDRYAPPG